MNASTRAINRPLIGSKVDKEMQHRIVAVIRGESKLIKKAIINQQKLMPKKRASVRW